jgi:hypothetical protein
MFSHALSMERRVCDITVVNSATFIGALGFFVGAYLGFPPARSGADSAASD